METTTMLKYAEMGARMRLDQLDEERSRILTLFPTLNGSHPDQPVRGAWETPEPAMLRSSTAPLPTESVTITGTRKRRTMSAAQRKALGRRMRKFWAARRAAKAKDKG